MQKSNRKLRDWVYSLYGNKCACCGEANSKFLSIDHVYNDGNKERRKGVKGAGSWYIHKRIKDYPELRGRYQLLCMNCNHGKARNGGICPHKTGKAA